MKNDLDVGFFEADLKKNLDNELFNNSFFKNKSILITGASGLIGSYLLSFFIGLDSKLAPKRIIAVSRNKLPNHFSRFKKNPSFIEQQIDLSQSSELYKIPNADIIFHCAGYAQPSLFMSSPISTISVNVTSTITLLEKLNKNGRFIFMSSSEVYCGLEGKKCKEEVCGTSTPYHPRASYIEGKRTGEAICASYHSKGIKAISVRLGDIYGPGTKPNDQRAINSFIEKAIKTKVIGLRDKGQASRSYCYVTDAVELILKILLTGKKNIYNLGSPINKTILELANIIAFITESKVVLPDVENEIKGAPPSLIMDLTSIMDEFGKKEFKSLEIGLNSTINWQKKIYGYE